MLRAWICCIVTRKTATLGGNGRWHVVGRTVITTLNLENTPIVSVSALWHLALHLVPSCILGSLGSLFEHLGLFCGLVGIVRVNGELLDLSDGAFGQGLLGLESRTKGSTVMQDDTVQINRAHVAALRSHPLGELGIETTFLTFGTKDGSDGWALVPASGSDLRIGGLVPDLRLYRGHAARVRNRSVDSRGRTNQPIMSHGY